MAAQGRIEDYLQVEPGKAHPRCIGGSGACPPEDCGGPAGFMAGRDATLSLDASEDMDIMAEIIGHVVQERRMDLLDDEETRWRLEQAVERTQAREQAQGHPFSRRIASH